MAKVFELGEESPSGFTLESTLNIGEDPPYGLFKTGIEDELSWHCNYTEEGNHLTGVYRFKSKSDGKLEYVEQTYNTIADAKFVRGELLNEGWQKIKPPKVNYTIGGK
jgi:hypothetical protein